MQANAVAATINYMCGYFSSDEDFQGTAMNNISKVLLSSSVLLAVGAMQAANMASVSAGPSSSSSTAASENATSPQLKPGISPDQPAKSNIRYECNNEADNLSTVAHTERGVIELIVWESHYFGSNWSPAKRCEAVSQRFQQFSDQRSLRFVSTGNLNNYNVICISEKAGNCIDQGLLLTLEQQDKPTQVLRDLFNYRASIRRGPQTKVVIDFEQLLNERPPIAAPANINVPDAPNTTSK